MPPVGELADVVLSGDTEQSGASQDSTGEHSESAKMAEGRAVNDRVFGSFPGQDSEKSRKNTEQRMTPAHHDPDEITVLRRLISLRRSGNNQYRYALSSQATRKGQRSQLVAADAVELGRDKADAPERLLQSDRVPAHDGRHFLQNSSRASMFQIT